MQLVSIQLLALDQPLDALLALVADQRQAERDVPPLPGVLREPEALTEALDDPIRLPLAGVDVCENVLHRALKRLLVDRPRARR